MYFYNSHSLLILNPEVNLKKNTYTQRITIILHILFLASIFSTYSLTAQTSATTISGIVTDSTSGETLVGATVTITDSKSPATKRGAITNKFGFYSLQNIAPGSYQLSASSIGYTSRTIPIAVISGEQSRKLNIQLGSRPIESGQVIVEGKSDKEISPSIGRVDLRPEFLKRLPSLGGEVDIFRAIQLLPGVKASSELSSGLYVRGGSADETLILLDGVTVYNPSHLGGFLSTFNADAIKDIKLIKGSIPAEYGGRLSSVLDLTMREGTKEKFSGTAGISLINSRLALEGPISENGSFMVSGRRMYLDLFTAILNDSIIPTYYFYDVNAKANYKLSDNDRIYLSGYFGRDVLDYSSGSDGFRIDWGNATGNFRWAHILSPSIFTNFSAIATTYSFNSRIGGTNESTKQQSYFATATNIRDLTGRAELQATLGDGNLLKTGMELTHHGFRSAATTDIADLDKVEREPTIFNSLDVSAYLQNEWQITPQLFTNIGVRGYYFESGKYSGIEPRISMSYLVNEDLSLKAGYSTANQPLHLVSRNDIALPTDIWFPSTPQLKPESATEWSFGTETSFAEQEYKVSVEGYYKQMHNLLEYKDTINLSLHVPVESFFTAGDGRAYGVELFINKQIGRLTGWIGYTISFTERTFAELNDGLPFNPRYDRTHDASIVAAYALNDKWDVGVVWVYGTGNAYTMPTGQYEFSSINATSQNAIDRNRLNYSRRNGYRLPAYHRLDLSASLKFSWFDLPWIFSMNIYNAYNHRNFFAQYISPVYDRNSVTGQSGSGLELRRVTYFPILPTVGLSVKF